MALYLERYVLPIGTDVTTEHRVRVRFEAGSFAGLSLEKASRLARPYVSLSRSDRPWTLRVLVDPEDP